MVPSPGAAPARFIHGALPRYVGRVSVRVWKYRALGLLREYRVTKKSSRWRAYMWREGQGAGGSRHVAYVVAYVGGLEAQPEEMGGDLGPALGATPKA